MGRGSYALILRLDTTQAIRVGRLGEQAFTAGFYVYVGSAFGSGGLSGRLKHHLTATPRPHWHIDYLRRQAGLREVWVLESDVRREHEWAALFQRMPGASLPVARFGASDCACASHLFHFPHLPDFSLFQVLACDNAIIRLVLASPE